MYLNQDFSRRRGGSEPLVYVDADDAALAEHPVLAAAVAEGRNMPLVLVGDAIKTPPTISVYWIEDELAKLDRELVGASDGGQD
jgi:hypothetical protein